MSLEGSRKVTDLLIMWGEGDRASQNELWPLVYGELRRTADVLMNGERRGHTLQPTAIII